MKHIKVLGLILAAACAIAALLATTAFALPELLIGTNGKPTTFTGSAEKTSTLENSAGTKVECTEANGKGGFETDTLGTFKIEFEKCKAEGFACKTEGGSTEEQIVSEGSFHFVYDVLGTSTNLKDEEEGGSLGVAILFLPKETKFGCLKGIIKDTVKGTVLCLILLPLTLSLTHLFHCLPGVGKGEAGEKTYWNDNGTAVTVQLLSSQNSGEFKESNEQALSTMTTPLAGAWMNE